MTQSKVEFIPDRITDRLLRECRFLSWVNDKTGEPIYRRAHIEHHPRAFWDSTDVFALSIYCEANHHGDFYLHISKAGADLKWHCFLVNGRWSETFIHLRQLEYFSELQEIVWAITRCNLFNSEYAMKLYCKHLLQPNTNEQ
jgi:hypothetical protein